MSIKDGDIPETDEEMYGFIDNSALLKEPRPKVKLVGKDGNAFAIMGACKKAWWESNKIPQEKAKWASIQKDMMSGDYNHLLQVAMKYFEVR